MKDNCGRTERSGRLILVYCIDLVEHRGDPFEQIQYRGIKMPGHCSVVPFSYYAARLRVREGLFIWPLAPQGVILINKHCDPSFERYYLPFQPLRIAGPVPPFVVTERNRGRHLDSRVGWGREHVIADRGMGFHDLDLL